jgi:hypothetical protein
MKQCFDNIEPSADGSHNNKLSQKFIYHSITAFSAFLELAHPAQGGAAVLRRFVAEHLKLKRSDAKSLWLRNL